MFYCFYFSPWVLEDIKREQGFVVLSSRKEVLCYVYICSRAGTTGLKMWASWLATEGGRWTSGHKLHVPGEEQLFAPKPPGTWTDTIQDKPACVWSSHVETLQAQQHSLQEAHEAGGKDRCSWSWHTSPGGSRWAMLVTSVVKRESWEHVASWR